MSLLVVGSIALDTLTTPAGKVEDTLGGSAVYFSLAACSFDRIRIVGVVGPDFPVTENLVRAVDGEVSGHRQPEDTLFAERQGVPLLSACQTSSELWSPPVLPSLAN